LELGCKDPGVKFLPLSMDPWGFDLGLGDKRVVTCHIIEQHVLYTNAGKQLSSAATDV
jgi:hypothetical protein